MKPQVRKVTKTLGFKFKYPTWVYMDGYTTKVCDSWRQAMGYVK